MVIGRPVLSMAATGDTGWREEHAVPAAGRRGLSRDAEPGAAEREQRYERRDVKWTLQINVSVLTVQCGAQLFLRAGFGSVLASSECES